MNERMPTAACSSRVAVWRFSLCVFLQLDETQQHAALSSTNRQFEQKWVSSGGGTDDHHLEEHNFVNTHRVSNPVRSKHQHLTVCVCVVTWATFPLFHSLVFLVFLMSATDGRFCHTSAGDCDPLVYFFLFLFHAMYFFLIYLGQYTEKL